jgi:hypothetical protein
MILHFCHLSTGNSVVYDERTCSFVGLDHASVKQYLMDFAQARASGACTVVYDSTAEFLDVLCTRMAGGPHEVAAPGEAEVVAVDDQVLARAGDAAVQPMVEEDEDAPAASGWIVHNHFICSSFQILLKVFLVPPVM